MNDLTLNDPILRVRDGRIYADSRDVAARFEKRHDNVVRDIRALVAKEPKLGLLNFEEFKINDLTGESTSHVEMTRDGFSRRSAAGRRGGAAAFPRWPSDEDGG